MLEWRSTNFTVVRNVLRNNYQSRNLIGHYPFWVISPRNSTSFTRPFLAGRRAQAGHETTLPSHLCLVHSETQLVDGDPGLPVTRPTAVHLAKVVQG